MLPGINEKGWIDTLLETPAKVYECFTASVAILLLMPRLFRVLMSFYHGAKFTLEIKEHLEASQKAMLAQITDTRQKILTHLSRIDDGQLNLIEARRHTLDADMNCIWFMTDAQGQTEWVSAAWTRITGMPVEDALGSGWELAVLPEDLARVLNAWRLSFEHKRRCVDEFTLVHNITGRRTKVQVTANPIKRPDGTVLNYYGCSRITGTNPQLELAAASPVT